MRRISSNMPIMDNRFRMAERDFQKDRLQRGIASSRALGNLRDDPLAAAHITRLDSAGQRTARYLQNTEVVKGRWAQAEGYMSEAVSIVQRLRELSIQGASGTYARDDMAYMATEVDALVAELAQVANAKGGDGRYLFAGDDGATPPFRTETSRVPGMGPDTVTGVHYSGDLGQSRVEISDGKSVEVNLAGNSVFWAEHQRVFGATDAGNLRVEEENRFFH